ncbi:polysaccharide deacetylase family protein [Pontibacter akesuensis]|uniref:Peptidoglycan/xylan/chitin deacetylase, PgdA/CDA1 family n=1 Tax=Pontibacter akesuensis TaxID=388950 RepID=A0A1I7KFL1_9BACT|nr:polysaccharide deacetylase family protein [Pontibacter akesuensis]GHA79534.1 chitooligosaccharide deacetylase [Pontibacter akesuensis]SFU96237.1 Peptidoglycan/xylan/chitin deacetylase, PgdA/CDA1 family [Pontibacter akesuensis]
MKSVVILILCLCGLPVFAQQKNVWNGKRAAVVLTYDDALHVHLDNAIPALDLLGLKGTFFLTAAAPAFTERLKEWEKVASNKHELANHTLFHPCIGSRPGREFVTPEYDLATYTVRRITDEIKVTNTMLNSVDGKTERTFAYPCGDTTVGGVPYVDAVKENFVAARGVQGKMVPRNEQDLYNIGTYMISGQTGEELIALVKEAMKTNSLVVFLFHGVGGEHGLNVSLEAHRKLLHFLKAQEKHVWNPTFLEAANYLKAEEPVKKASRK